MQNKTSSFSSIDPESLSRGTRIKFLRKDKGWTQVQLGDKMGVSDTHISKWENDEGISKGNLIKLASILETTVEFIEAGKSHKKGPSDEQSDSSDIDEITNQALQLARLLKSDKSAEPELDDRIRGLELAELMIRLVKESLKKESSD